MTILNFDDFVNEGLWSGTFDRARDGEKRKEDIDFFDKMCEFIGNLMAKKMKIPYSRDLCKIEPDEENEGGYIIHCNFGELAMEYEDIMIDFVPDQKCESYEELADILFYVIDQFQDSGFEYEDYEDPYMSSKRQFNQIRRIFQYIVNELGKI